MIILSSENFGVSSAMQQYLQQSRIQQSSCSNFGGINRVKLLEAAQIKQNHPEDRD